jgi:uncharacterized integral membrane protein
MNKTKLVLWLIVAAFLGLVIFQNESFFMEQQSLRLNLWIFNEWMSPELPVAVIALGFLVFGLILAYLFGLPGRFNARKSIKRLNATVSSQTDELDKLNKEMNALKGVPEAEEEGQAASLPEGSSPENSNEDATSQDSPTKFSQKVND